MKDSFHRKGLYIITSKNPARLHSFNRARACRRHYKRFRFPVGAADGAELRIYRKIAPLKAQTDHLLEMFTPDFDMILMNSRIIHSLLGVSFLQCFHNLFSELCHKPLGDVAVGAEDEAVVNLAVRTYGL